MTPPNQLKRPRADSSSGCVPPIQYPDVPDSHCTISTRFWHTKDGDILIRVKTTLYLLHRRLLATHSKLFQPEAIGEMASGREHKGMQVFAPPCDCVQSWEHVLTSIYDPIRVNIWGKTLSSDQLFSLIRVAYPLKFYNVVILCMEPLETELPITLDRFDAIYTVPTIGSTLRSTAYISSKEKLFHAINLALDFNHKRALPCAYLLALMEANVEDITQGIPFRNSSSRVQLHTEARNALLNARDRINPILLRRFSDAICSNARRNLCNEKPPSIACRSAATALEAKLRAYIFNSITVDRRLVITSWKEGEWFEEAFKDRCDTCSERAKKQILLQRQKFWDGIPALFGLGKGWDNLGRISK